MDPTGREASRRTWCKRKTRLRLPRTPRKTIVTFSPFATTLWDFIHRAMPLQRAGTLKPDEVYGLTAFLLYKNGIIQETDVLDAQSLPKVKMPNRDGFIPPDVSQYKPGTPLPIAISSDPAPEKK